jgi:hypothetical protein
VRAAAEGMTRAEIDAAIAKHADTGLLFAKPYEDKKRVHVAGRFASRASGRTGSPRWTTRTDPSSETTVEQADNGTSYEQTIFDDLRKAGVQNGLKAERIAFETLAPRAGQWVQAVGEYLDAEGYTRRSASVSARSTAPSARSRSRRPPRRRFAASASTCCWSPRRLGGERPGGAAPRRPPGGLAVPGEVLGRVWPAIRAGVTDRTRRGAGGCGSRASLLG